MAKANPVKLSLAKWPAESPPIPKPPPKPTSNKSLITNYLIKPNDPQLLSPNQQPAHRPAHPLQKPNPAKDEPTVDCYNQSSTHLKREVEILQNNY